MKKTRHQSITLLLILLLVAMLCIIGLRGTGGENGSAIKGGDTNLAQHQADRFGPAGEGIQAPRNRRADPNKGLHQGAKPGPVDSYSSQVNAELQAGETLVMGGYRTADGNHEFTMLTPTPMTMEDGSQAIMVRAKALRISPELARKHGMNSLATQYPTADHHAEAWSQTEIRSVLQAIGNTEGAMMMSAPGVITRPGEAARIETGSYSIENTVTPTAGGGFSFQSMVEHKTGKQP